MGKAVLGVLTMKGAPGLGEWELQSFHQPGGRGTCQVLLKHSAVKIRAASDDLDLVSRAGLVPVMTLALALARDLPVLAHEQVGIGRRAGQSGGGYAASVTGSGGLDRGTWRVVLGCTPARQDQAVSLPRNVSLSKSWLRL